MTRNGGRKRFAFRTVGLFSGTAVFCFLLLRASVAQSYYWTMNSTECNGGSDPLQSPYVCPLINRTGNYRIGVLTSACATMWLVAGSYYDNYIVKQSFTGSVYQDWNTYHQPSPNSYNTLCVGAGNVLTNASSYDYLYVKEVREGGGTLDLDSVTLNNSL